MIRNRIFEAGACAAGFARIEPVPEDIRRRYAAWIERGCHGTMEYLERYGDVRSDPALLLDGARTLISCAFAYRSGRSARSRLFADYAVGSDYHEVLRKALAPVAGWLDGISAGTRICIDTAPLRERFWAARAGVGFIGLNNQLIVPGAGSRVFLAEILWTGELPADPSREDEHCLRCGKCRLACPGKCIDGNGALDARSCLSYLTIEHHGELPDDLRLPGRIYGCDYCQDVCPHNRGVAPAVLEDFEPRPDVLALTVGDIAAMDQPSFSRIFTHSAVKRAKLAGLKRNVLKRR